MRRGAKGLWPGSVTIFTVCAAVVCPIVNTGVFAVCSLLFFYDDIAVYAAVNGFTGSPLLFVLVGFIGLNFVLELSFNVVLAPVIVRILKATRAV